MMTTTPESYGNKVAKVSGPSRKGNPHSGIIPEYKIPFPEGSDFVSKRAARA